MAQPASSITHSGANAGLVRTAGRALAAVVLASIVASLLDAVVAAIWHAAGASPSFAPLHPSAYVSLTVFGIVLGTVGWCVVRARAADPARVLRVLVPLVIVLSFIPDVLVGARGSAMAGATWGAVSGLMLMHLLVATAALAALRVLLPLPSSRR